MSTKVHHDGAAANDNAGPRCPECGHAHSYMSPAELRELASKVRLEAEREHEGRSAFSPWPLQRIPEWLRGIDGVCPVAFSPLERALVLRAQQEDRLIAEATRSPSSAEIVAAVVERAAVGLQINALEPLARAEFSAVNVVVVYKAAARAVSELESEGIPRDDALSGVVSTLVFLRRKARLQALPDSEWPKDVDPWLNELRAESVQFGAWLARSLPGFRSDASARGIAHAITEQDDDGRGRVVYAALPSFRSIRGYVNKYPDDEPTPAELLAVDLLSRAITETRITTCPAASLDRAENW